MTGAARHDVLVVLGTGLFPVAAQLGATGPPIDLTSLPWFSRFTGPGHRPEAWSVPLGEARVLVVAGRLHLYEGATPSEVVHGVRTAIAAGVRTVILTCSAGGLNPAFSTGEVVAISDHLNLTGTSPLLGEAVDAVGGGRHIEMTDAWSPRLRMLTHAVAPVREGVYAQVLSPELETPAEIKMLATLGADLVGMSTVPEAIAARHLGAEVLGLAVVTNAAAGMGGSPVALDEIVDTAGRAVEEVTALTRGVIEQLHTNVTAEGDSLRG